MSVAGRRRSLADLRREAQNISRLTGTTWQAAFQSLLIELNCAELEDARAEALAATRVRRYKGRQYLESCEWHHPSEKRYSSERRAG